MALRLTVVTLSRLSRRLLVISLLLFAAWLAFCAIAAEAILDRLFTLTAGAGVTVVGKEQLRLLERWQTCAPIEELPACRELAAARVETRLGAAKVLRNALRAAHQKTGVTTEGRWRHWDNLRNRGGFRNSSLADASNTCNGHIIISHVTQNFASCRQNE